MDTHVWFWDVLLPNDECQFTAIKAVILLVTPTVRFWNLAAGRAPSQPQENHRDVDVGVKRPVLSSDR